MVHLSQRVHLVHELRELGATEELAHSSDNRTDVDQCVRCSTLRILYRHTLLHHTLHPQQPHSELVLDKLSHRSHTPVPKVVYVIAYLRTLRVVQTDHVPHYVHDVLTRHRPHVLPHYPRVHSEAVRLPLRRQLVPAYPRQVVPA